MQGVQRVNGYSISASLGSEYGNVTLFNRQNALVVVVVGISELSFPHPPMMEKTVFRPFFFYFHSFYGDYLSHVGRA
jgi:hypothetical protein